MATLDTGSGSPQGILEGTTQYFSDGGKAGTLILSTLFGVIVSIATGGINVTQSIFGLIAEPLDSAGTAIADAFETVILEPLGPVVAGSDISSGSLEQFGVLALPAGIVLLLGSYYIVTVYLKQTDTPDLIPVPGFPDLPFVGVDEDPEEDEE